MKIERDRDTAIVSFPEIKILDEEIVRRATEHLVTEHLAAQPAGNLVVVNCANLEGASSAALGALLILRSRVLRARGTLTLSNASDRFRKLLTSLRLDRLLDLEPQ